MISLFKKAFTPGNGRAMSSLVNLTVNDKTGIAKLDMNQPPVNSLSSALMEEMLNKVDQLKKNESVRGVLIASSSKNIFSAGLNLAETYNTNETAFRKFYYLFQELNYQLYKAPFLTAAAINGHAPAGGCIIALTADYRVMVNNPERPFRIGLNESSLGMAAPVWVQRLMSDVMGKRQTAQAVLSSTLFATEEAFRIGLIDEMADNAEDALEKAESYLDMYRDMPLFSIIETKLTTRKEFISKFESEREFDMVNFSKLVLAPAAQDLIGRFLDVGRALHTNAKKQ